MRVSFTESIQRLKVALESLQVYLQLQGSTVLCASPVCQACARISKAGVTDSPALHVVMVNLLPCIQPKITLDNSYSQGDISSSPIWLVVSTLSMQYIDLWDGILMAVLGNALKSWRNFKRVLVLQCMDLL